MTGQAGSVPSEGYAEDYGPMTSNVMGSSRRQRARSITSDRRRELYGLADYIAKQIETKTEEHERSLLFDMVQSLLPQT